MSNKARKIPTWKIVVIFGAMAVFVLGIPSLPGKHLVYWVIAFVIEAALSVVLLRPVRSVSN